MTYFFPENIFTKIIIESLPVEFRKNVKFLPGSLIAPRLKEDQKSVGLIPTTDLIQHKELFVSHSFGISFEESLCNTYLYYFGNENKPKDLYLLGDISSLEVILSKIFFKEIYATDIEVHIVTDNLDLKGKNTLISGDVNFQEDAYKVGISLAEEMVELLSYPFVNYLLASVDGSLIDNFNKEIKGISSTVYSNVENNNFVQYLSSPAKEYVKDNISSFVCEFDDKDIEGTKQLLRLPYYHGVIHEIIEVKFV